MGLVCEREWRGLDPVEAQDGFMQSTDLGIHQRGPRGGSKDVEASGREASGKGAPTNGTHCHPAPLGVRVVDTRGGDV